MTFEQAMMIISFVMVIGSIGWAAWDVHRKHRARQRESEHWRAKIRQHYESDEENDAS